MSLESTRITLVKCMRKLMRERSFYKFSVDDICSMAHVSRRTFYRHFPDKYSLLHAAYMESFYLKLDITEEDHFWDIFDKMCLQIDSDRDFFKHALEVEGQNGFKEELTRLWVPLLRKGLPLNDVTDRESVFYTEQTVYMILDQIQLWLTSKTDFTPADFAKYVRSSFAVYGKWSYELAVGKTPSEYSSDYVSEVERERSLL